MAYLYLAVAIVFEVFATTALKASDGFTRLWPSLAVVAGYGVAFFCLSLCLRTMDVGAAYAIWCAVGIVLVTASAAVFYKQVPDAWAMVGMGMIIAGVVVLFTMSRSVSH